MRSGDSLDDIWDSHSDGAASGRRMSPSDEDICRQEIDKFVQEQENDAESTRDTIEIPRFFTREQLSAAVAAERDECAKAVVGFTKETLTFDSETGYWLREWHRADDVIRGR